MEKGSWPHLASLPTSRCGVSYSTTSSLMYEVSLLVPISDLHWDPNSHMETLVDVKSSQKLWT